MTSAVRFGVACCKGFAMHDMCSRGLNRAWFRRCCVEVLLIHADRVRSRRRSSMWTTGHVSVRPGHKSTEIYMLQVPEPKTASILSVIACIFIYRQPSDETDQILRIPRILQSKGHKLQCNMCQESEERYPTLRRRECLPHVKLTDSKLVGFYTYRSSIP